MISVFCVLFKITIPLWTSAVSDNLHEYFIENILMQFFLFLCLLCKSEKYLFQKISFKSGKLHFLNPEFANMYFFGISNELFFCSVWFHERNISFFVRVYGLLENKKRKLFLWFFIIYSKQNKWFFRMVTVVWVEMCWIEGFTYWDLSFNLIGFLWRASYWAFQWTFLGHFRMQI